MGLNDFENQAIPHEAGHIIVGLAKGFPVMGMSVIIFREAESTRPGNFITKSIEPIAQSAPQNAATNHCKPQNVPRCGLAGNIVAAIPPAGEALQDDRRKLARVGNEKLEEMAAVAEPIIREHMEGFLKVVAAIGDRCLALKNDLSLGTGEYLLLTQQELLQLSGIDVPPLY